MFLNQQIMKTINNHLKIVSLFLSTLILLQGCTVYKSANVSLDDAYKSQTKVKVIKKNGEKVKFKRIIFEDGHYKSIKDLGGGTVKTQIEVDKIEKVQLKDKVLSIIMSFGIPLIFIGGLVLCCSGGFYSGISVPAH